MNTHSTLSGVDFGTASYTVFSTDYENYCAIFTCQKLPVGHRLSISILSKKRTLDKTYMDKVTGPSRPSRSVVTHGVIIRQVLQQIASYGVDPYDLSIIRQRDCPDIYKGAGHSISIDDDTFTSKSLAGVVKKAGEKLGDGIEYVAEGGKKLYNRLLGDDDEATNEHTRGKTIAEEDSEWLP